MAPQPDNSDLERRQAAAKLPPRTPSLLGLFDFSYQHYALGDVLTSQVDLAVMATEQGIRHVDIVVAVSPHHPSAPLQASSRPPIMWSIWITSCRRSRAIR